MGTARKGKGEILARAAQEHAEALRRQPGCVAAFVLKERGTDAQISLAIFETEETFERGMNATHPVIAKHHLEELREGPSSFRVFDVY